MQQLAKGLHLTVTDRDDYEQFIRNNAHDPGVHYDSWGNNAPPTAIYIVSYYPEDEHPYYKALNEHTNGETTTTYINADLLTTAIQHDILAKDGHNVDFVDSHT